MERNHETMGVTHRKYTWTEVRQAVNDLRKELSSLSTMVPMSISFRKYGSNRCRIYFLRTPKNGWEITLLYADVIATNQHSDVRLEWKPLIDSSFITGAASSKFSREEQLLWERQRLAAWGIASYELHEPSGRILFPVASALFVACVDDERQVAPLIPRVVPTGGEGAALTPATCPREPRLLAHVARCDIWLAGVRRPHRLTYACTGASRLVDDPRQAGVPCYVTQEEFSRYTGFWWQPKSDDDVFRIVYEEVDESEVEIYSFPSSNASNGETEEFRFPRAGTANAKSILRLVTFKLAPSNSVVVDYFRQSDTDDDFHNSNNGRDTDCCECTEVRTYDLRRCLEESFPWYEYLVRVGWTPCGQYVWVQLLDRAQQRLELVLIHIDEFSEEFVYERSPNAEANIAVRRNDDETVFNKQILITETAPNAWINVHDILHFLPSEDQDRVTFIWASEETGYQHLYLITCLLRDAKMKRRKLLETAGECCSSGAVGPNIVTKTQLTDGQWEVIGRKIWVDEARGYIYFVGTRETPLERHLYRCSYKDSSEVQLLTTPGNSCCVDINEDCTMAVISYSNVSTPPVTRVYRIVHESGASKLISQGVLMSAPTMSRESSSPEVSEHSRWNGSRESSSSESSSSKLEQGTNRGEGDGDNMSFRDNTALSGVEVTLHEAVVSSGRVWCAMWRPRRLTAPAPTVLHVYGGPEVQLVTNSFKGVRQLRMHMLAARGFCVVCVDSRGSKHRGREWEAAIRSKMGQIELDDQVEALQWLAKQTGCIDLSRVAVHGWSYGGYLSLLALATRPYIFKACIAGAPVTSWRMYDTAYTERYMGLPAHAPHEYIRASVLPLADSFPDSEDRLLIIHGLADENVHFCHTAALVSELVKHCKPHRLQLYPSERHSLRALNAAKHYEATLIMFLHNCL